MSLSAILLLTLSAVFHVGWNLAGKVSGPTPQFFRGVTTYAAVALAPVMIYGWPAFQTANALIWLYLLLSGLFQAIYFSGLAGAYFSGHLSVAYPLARTWPALIIVFVTVLRGNGDAITWVVIGGIVLILAGSTILPLGNLRAFRVSTYANASCAFAILAAVGTAGYTMVDDAGLRSITSASALPHWQLAVMWLGYESTATIGWLWGFERLGIWQSKGDAPLPLSRWKMLFVSLGMSFAYALVLLSYTLVDDVSYVAGFRQLSVPLGAIAGIVILREPGPPIKLVGVLLMFAGLVCVALG